MNMKTQGERLREERERLGFSQADFAALGGLKKLAQIDYEKDRRSPDSNYLAAIAAAGVDVLYIVTGQRAGGALPNREVALLDNYRQSDERGKRIIEQTASVAAEPCEVKKTG